MKMKTMKTQTTISMNSNISEAEISKQANAIFQQAERRVSQRQQKALFDDSDGAIESNPNWLNQTIWTNDNLFVLKGMNSGSVDLIYLDPPFNSNKDYEGVVGTEGATASFKDTWTLDDTDIHYIAELEAESKLKGISAGEWHLIQHARFNHSPSMASYLCMMSPRLKEMKRVLKSTGSIYLHCDPTASHYLKGLMDFIFGRDSFRNEIIWEYPRARPGGKQFAKLHDTLFWYSKGKEWKFDKDKMQVPVSKEALKTKRIVRKDGSVWERKRDTKDMGTVWQITFPTRTKERCGYPTQKPLALLHRIIKASSSEGDVVLDPFCGCATACVAAEQLGRQWIGIDVGELAFGLVKSRLIDSNVSMQVVNKIANRFDPPARDDFGKLPKYNCLENKIKLKGIQDNICVLCGHTLIEQAMSVDHIYPRSKGGSDHISNLQLIHTGCNSIKGQGTNEEAMKKIREKCLMRVGWMGAK